MDNELSRRDLFAVAGATASLGVLSNILGSEAFASEKKGHMGGGYDHKLPELGYPEDALEPVIDKKTVNIHYNKHFAGYVKGLNATIKDLAKARKDGDYGAIKSLSRNLAFHGSGVVLHWTYFSTIGPDPGKPTDACMKMINRDFGSFDAFWSQFAAASKSVEASGWGILGWEPFSKRLVVMQAEKHQNLTSWGVVPLMVCDVWEHAYYLKYQNRRGEYVDNFRKIIDWKKVEDRFNQFCKA
jgi:Fe-Mn family superoxide dismutase